MEYKRGHNYPGLLITFEGRDGCGKSSQCKRFTRYLGQNGYSYLQEREPGGTDVGERIRGILLDHDSGAIIAITEVFLFQASRARLVSQKIMPSLERGKVVCLDRFVDSTTAYQGAAGEVPLESILFCNQLATQGISPDRTYVFDVNSETAARRLKTTLDRMEAKDQGYHERVRQAYLEISQLEPERVKVIDGTSDEETIHKQVIGDFEKMVEYFKYRK